MYQPRVESETASGQTTGEIKPTWADVKINRASFDRAVLLGVLQDLCAADEANRAYNKKTVDRWLWPDLFQGQRTSVSRAKGAITKYKQALGDPVV